MDTPQQQNIDRAPDLSDNAGNKPVVKDEDIRVLGYLHDDPSLFGARGAPYVLFNYLIWIDGRF